MMIAGGLRCRRVWPSAAFAGRISFPLYALQAPIGAIAAVSGLHISVAVALTVLAAHLSSRLGPKLRRRLKLGFALRRPLPS